MSYQGIIDQYIHDQLLSIDLHRRVGAAITVEDRGSRYHPCEPVHLTCRVEHALMSNYKKVNLEWVARELAWFIGGVQEEDYWVLNVNGLGPAKPMWEPWADSDGRIRVAYSDLFSPDIAIIPAYNELTENPWSRRAFASVGRDIDWALQPCHHTWQLVRNLRGELNVIFHMRSTDLGLGLPFNMASYAMFTMAMAKALGLQPGWIDAFLAYPHIYEDHYEPMAERYLAPPPASPRLDFETLWKSFPDVFQLEAYGAQPGAQEADSFFQSLHGYVRYPAPYLKLPLHYRPK